MMNFVRAKSAYFIDLNTEGLNEEQIQQAVLELDQKMRKRVLSCYTNLFFEQGQNVEVSNAKIYHWGAGKRGVMIEVSHRLRVAKNPNMIRILEVINRDMREAAAYENRWDKIHPLATKGGFSTHELFVEELSAAAV